jgi:hypothetical protein
LLLLKVDPPPTKRLRRILGLILDSEVLWGDDLAKVGDVLSGVQWDHLGFHSSPSASQGLADFVNAQGKPGLMQLVSNCLNNWNVTQHGRAVGDPEVVVGDATGREGEGTEKKEVAEAAGPCGHDGCPEETLICEYCQKPFCGDHMGGHGC